MRYTAEEVLQTKEALLGIVGMSDLAEAAGMLTAYADLLERSPRVTDYVITRALSAYNKWPSKMTPNERMRSRIRAALEAVWPVAADSKPSVQEEMSRKDAVINLIAAIWNIDSLRNRCRSDIDALREWLNREPSAEPVQEVPVAYLAENANEAFLFFADDHEGLDAYTADGFSITPLVRHSTPEASCGDCPTRDYKAAEPAQPAERDEIAEEAWRAFYRAADKVQKEAKSNG